MAQKSAASALRNLNLSGASRDNPMDTSEGNVTRSSGRGSMGGSFQRGVEVDEAAGERGGKGGEDRGGV